MTRDRSRERMKVRYSNQESDVFERARSMCSYMSDERISDYLGMVIDQVRAIRADVEARTYWGHPDPDSAYAARGGSGDHETMRYQLNAIVGSERLLEAMRRVA